MRNRAIFLKVCELQGFGTSETYLWNSLTCAWTAKKNEQKSHSKKSAKLLFGSWVCVNLVTKVIMLNSSEVLTIISPESILHQY